ncbi:hypothetical protein DNTS_009274 [Danionella cerebrum]|uniref:WAP four-disulfide core domain protein 1 n=1 Tax=Danionella cerebrum TaxID=2873325 RepID=A0A553Q5M6_9TELE|nr:hypothetical protein DNTS_009274 [Danionella translucida]
MTGCQIWNGVLPVPLLCFCLLLASGSGSSHRIRKRGLNQKIQMSFRRMDREWVDEDYEYPAPAQGPQQQQQQKSDRCPPPPQMLPERACEVPGCRSDSECERHKRCCYNGCIYACLESVQPPAVLDWLVQPKPRWLGGNGWLLDGPEEVLQAEACSTTEDGDEPLLCPTGYECHIINAGNPSAGIPNRGQCIKLRGNSGSNSNNAVSYEKHPQKHLG